MFRYEIHLHSSRCSACGGSAAKELVKALRAGEYELIVNWEVVKL